MQRDTLNNQYVCSCVWTYLLWFLSAASLLVLGWCSYMCLSSQRMRPMSCFGQKQKEPQVACHRQCKPLFLLLTAPIGCQELFCWLPLRIICKNVFVFFAGSPPGQPVSSLSVETMENSTVNDEAVHQRAPENPVQKISSSRWI